MRSGLRLPSGWCRLPHPEASLCVFAHLGGFCEFLLTLDMSPLSDVWFADVCFQSVACLLFLQEGPLHSSRTRF